MKKYVLLSTIIIVFGIILAVLIISKPNFEDEMQDIYQNDICKCCSVFLYKEIPSPDDLYYLKVNLAHSNKDGNVMIFGLVGSSNRGNNNEQHIYYEKCDKNLKANWHNGEYDSNINIEVYWIDNNTVFINGNTLSIVSVKPKGV